MFISGRSFVPAMTLAAAFPLEHLLSYKFLMILSALTNYSRE